MPAGLGETEMATVGVTGVVGAVSAVYYKMPSLPLPLGVRCPCGLHTALLFEIVFQKFEVKVRDQHAVIPSLGAPALHVFYALVHLK